MRKQVLDTEVGFVGRPHIFIDSENIGYVSKNVQGICDADLQLQSVMTRMRHDSIRYQNSRIQHCFDSREFNNFVLLGDWLCSESTPVDSVPSSAESSRQFI